MNEQPNQIGVVSGPMPSAGLQGWTMMLLCLGVGLIACCVLIPQADENRRLAHQCAKLEGDLEHLKLQASVNEEFVRRLSEDPSVAERLAQRQLRLVRKGTGVIELESEEDGVSRSPFSLVAVAGPPPMPAMAVPQGRLANWCRDPKSRLYLIAGGLLCVAMGLICGGERVFPQPKPSLP